MQIKIVYSKTQPRSYFGFEISPALFYYKEEKKYAKKRVWLQKILFCHNFVSSTSAKLTERKKPQLFFNFKVEAVESPPGREARTATALEE